MTGAKIKEFYAHKGDYKHEKFKYAMGKINQSDLETVPECANFLRWWATARPRDTFVYYRGPCLTSSVASWKVKCITWKYATSGYVYLVQRKLGYDNYEYIAQKSVEKIKKLIPHNTNEYGLSIARDAQWLNKVASQQQ